MGRLPLAVCLRQQKMPTVRTRIIATAPTTIGTVLMTVMRGGDNGGAGVDGEGGNVGGAGGGGDGGGRDSTLGALPMLCTVTCPTPP